MAFTINTNVVSLVAQQNLNQSQKALNQAIERLSSGRKINSAADDAAGLAIANRLTAQISGLRQAQANASDGISLAQTAEGALDQINTNLQRIRELSVQAANGAYSQSDLNSMQSEIEQRLAEINRVAQQTAFNGTKLLNKDQSVEIQVGADDGQTITIDLQKISTSTLGVEGFNVNGYDLTSAVTSLSSVTSLTDVEGDSVSTITVADIGGSVSGTLVEDADGDYFIEGSAGNIFTVENLQIDASGNTATVKFDSTSEQLSEATDSPMSTVSQALESVGELRSTLGATQNRLESAITNISTTTTNLTAAKSRIVDTNYAVAVSQLSKARILQQAGTAVLAQANTTQQGVLALLR